MQARDLIERQKQGKIASKPSADKPAAGAHAHAHAHVRSQPQQNSGAGRAEPGRAEPTENGEGCRPGPQAKRIRKAVAGMFPGSGRRVSRQWRAGSRKCRVAVAAEPAEPAETEEERSTADKLATEASMRTHIIRTQWRGTR